MPAASRETAMASGGPERQGHHPFVGGVDSSVSALLLRQQGYDIEGLFMKNWEEDDTETYCAAAQDVADARSVCEAIGIDRVFTRFLKEYEAGRTPNPERQLSSAAARAQFLFFRISHSNIWLTPGPDCGKAPALVSAALSKGGTMNDDLGNRVRLDQTGREIKALSGEIKAWIDLRQKKDNLKQYQTQLLTLKDFLLKSLCDLRSALSGVSAGQQRGQVYVECRKFDKRLVVARRVWEFFRLRFDQRDDPKLEEVLKSADEIVWSCYAGSFQSTANLTGVNRQTAPLPYIQPRYSPEAHTRNDPPPELKSDVDLQFVQAFLMKLPVPVLGLPPACVEAPWWLIFLGHEVGHHIQHDLLPNFGLLEGFGQLLRAGAAAAGDGQHDPERWAKWNEEVFADVFSVLQLGPWAAWAMAELEQADELTMLSGGKGRYPIPVVRLALLSRLNEELKVNDASAQLQLKPAEMTVGQPLTLGNVNLRETAANDLKAVPSVVKAALNQLAPAAPALGEAGSLTDLFGWTGDEFQPHGKIANRREALLGRAPLFPEKTLSAARFFISAAVAAWIEVAAIADDAQREQMRAMLRANLLDVLPKSREEGTRAASAPLAAPAQDFGGQFASLLLEANADQLGA